jgi:hypothetical protein
MKLMILSLVLPLSALAAKDDLVTCQIKDMKVCTQCEKRIPASCENHSFNGFLESSLKPRKVQWVVSNTQAGTEKTVMSENSKYSLKDLNTSKDLKSIATKMKVTIGKDETVSLTSVQVAPSTALYKESKGSQTVAQMKVQTNLRTVASSQEPNAGGVKRAQAQTQGKK